MLKGHIHRVTHASWASSSCPFDVFLGEKDAKEVAAVHASAHLLKSMLIHEHVNIIIIAKAQEEFVTQDVADSGRAFLHASPHCIHAMVVTDKSFKGLREPLVVGRLELFRWRWGDGSHTVSCAAAVCTLDTHTSSAQMHQIDMELIGSLRPSRN